MAVGVFGVFGALLTLLPDYSPVALGIALVIGLAGAVAAVDGAGRATWWHQIVVVNSWFLLMLGLAIRSWNAVVPALGLWVPLFVGLYALAWSLPSIEPKLSALLYREQIAPETRIGRGCLGLALAVGGAAAGTGATLGMYGARYGQEKLVLLAMAALGTFVTLGWGQYVAHDMWPKRPWGEQAEKSQLEAD